MNNTQLEEYLEEHLNNELQWLLRAATEWHIQDRLNLELDGYHIQVYAMDSTFLHARTLFEFFTNPTSNNYYGLNAFGLSPLTSTLYSTDWVSVLHGYLMHAQDRSNPRPVSSFDGTTTKHLNQMPVDFAHEVVRLWKDFVIALRASSDSNMRALAPIADAILNDAIANAKRVHSRFPVQEPDLSTVPSIVW